MWRYFLPIRLSVIVQKITRKSHRNHTGLLNGFQACLGLLEVLPDEFAIGAKYHLHILMPELLSDIAGVAFLFLAEPEANF